MFSEASVCSQAEEWSAFGGGRAVADLGFPRDRGANSRGGGGRAPTYDFAKISQKLHEIDRIWTRPLRPP